MDRGRSMPEVVGVLPSPSHGHLDRTTGERLATSPAEANRPPPSCVKSGAACAGGVFPSATDTARNVTTVNQVSTSPNWANGRDGLVARQASWRRGDQQQGAAARAAEDEVGAVGGSQCLCELPLAPASDVLCGLHWTRRCRAPDHRYTWLRHDVMVPMVVPGQAVAILRSDRFAPHCRRTAWLLLDSFRAPAVRDKPRRHLPKRADREADTWW